MKARKRIIQFISLFKESSARFFCSPPSTHPLPKISRFSKSDLVPGSSLEKYMPGKEFLRAQWYLDRVRGKSIADWPNGIKIGPAVDETRLWYP